MNSNQIKLPAATKVFVRFTQPALNDLRDLLKLDPQIVRLVLKKILLIERNPEAGEPLLGHLIGWRKLTVGNRHWRIVWKISKDQVHGIVLEIAEIWAIGARAESDIYQEMKYRISTLPENPNTTSLAEVVDLLGRASGGISVSNEPDSIPVPEWLARKLRFSLGKTQQDINGLTGDEALSLWEDFIRGQNPQS